MLTDFIFNKISDISISLYTPIIISVILDIITPLLIILKFFKG